MAAFFFSRQVYASRYMYVVAQLRAENQTPARDQFRGIIYTLQGQHYAI